MSIYLRFVHWVAQPNTHPESKYPAISALSLRTGLFAALLIAQGLTALSYFYLDDEAMSLDESKVSEAILRAEPEEYCRQYVSVLRPCEGYSTTSGMGLVVGAHNWKWHNNS